MKPKHLHLVVDLAQKFPMTPPAAWAEFEPRDILRALPSGSAVRPDGWEPVLHVLLRADRLPKDAKTLSALLYEAHHQFPECHVIVWVARATDTMQLAFDVEIGPFPLERPKPFTTVDTEIPREEVLRDLALVVGAALGAVHPRIV